MKNKQMSNSTNGLSLSTGSSIEHRISLIFNKTILSFNSLMKNKAVLVLLILMPMFSMVPVMFFIPLWGGGAFVVQTNVLITTGLIYGTILFGYDRSTLSKNEGLTTKSKSYRYLSALIVIFVLIGLSTMFQIFLMFFLNAFNLILPDWTFMNNDNRILVMKNLKFGAWIWAVYWTMLIEFGILFVFRNVIKSIKSHYFVILSMVIIAFVWGGSLNDYFTNIMVTQDGGSYEMEMIGGLFPSSMYWPTIIFFPFFAPGQMASIATDFAIGVREGSDFILYQQYDKWLVNLSLDKQYAYEAQWNALIITPIIWMGSLTTIGLLIKTEH